MEAEVDVADESAMGADGKLGLVFDAHQSLSLPAAAACAIQFQAYLKC